MKRFIIANIGLTKEINYLAPDVGVIHSKLLTVSPAEQAASFWVATFGAEFNDVGVVPETEVSTVYYGVTLFSKVDTYSELLAIPNSFYWDFDAQTLYIRIFRDTPEFGIPTQYAYGLAVGLIDSSDISADGLIDSTIGGIAYHPALITGGMSAMVQIDNFSESKMTMDDFYITINNASGLWDNARSIFYKQRVDVFLADVPYERPAVSDDFVLVRSGIVDTTEYQGDTTVQITAIDPRRTWDRVVHFDVFTDADFEVPTENRALSYIGKVKPLCIGEMVKVPTVPLSGENDLTATRHQVSSVAYGQTGTLTGAWEIIDGLEVARTQSYSPTTGVATITDAQYKGGEIVVSGMGLQLDRAVYVDSVPVPGYTNTPQQIAYWLAYTLGGIPNTGGYFDRQSFREAEAYGSDSSVYIPAGGEKLLDIIDRITTPANWAMYVEAGVFKASRFGGDSSNPDRLYVDELAAPPGISWDNSGFATRIQYGYRQTIYDEKSRSIFDDSKEAALIPRYRVTELSEILSPLNDDIAATALKDERYDRISFIPAVLEVDLLETPRWDMFDFVIFDYLMDGRRRLPEMVYRVVGVDKIGKRAVLRQYEDTPELEGSVYSIYREISGKSA